MTERVAAEILSLPMFPELTPQPQVAWSELLRLRGEPHSSLSDPLPSAQMGACGGYGDYKHAMRDQYLRSGLCRLGVGSVSCRDGHDVLGIDVDRGRSNCINRGWERGGRTWAAGADRIRRVRSGKLRATTEQVTDADVSMVCVGTPSNENGSLCLDHIVRASRADRRLPRPAPTAITSSASGARCCPERSNRWSFPFSSNTRARKPGATSASA